MKELSVEEKAKRYDNMFERLKEMYNNNKTNVADRLIYERYFPELKESEDERIKRVIKQVLNESTTEKDECYSNNGVTQQEVFAWLEKQGEQKSIDDLTQQEAMDIAVAKCFEQGEQKPADKAEPKFHEGDIIIHKELGGDYIHNPHKIIQVDILDKKYRLEGGLVAHFDEQDDYELVEQNNAWSKDDEQYLLVCKNALAKYQVSDKWDAGIISRWLEDKLKSLRPQNTWKPSESDIRILEQVIDGTVNPINYHATLHAILEKLKKLREE